MRARIPLLEDGEEVRLRVPTAVAQAVQADPAAVVRAMARAAEEKLKEITEKNIPVREGWPTNEDPDYYTPWATTEPPAFDGLYDVTDNRSGTLNARWWFCGTQGPLMWFAEGPPPLDLDDVVRALSAGRSPRLKPTAKAVMHDEFIGERGLAWRGLRQQPRDPYPVPPYWPPHLPPGAAINGKYIKRTALED